MENNQTKFQAIKKESEIIRKQVQQQTLSYIVAAFSLVAGLAWNEAIKALIEYLFPLSKNNLQAKFLYAFLITFAVVLISIYLNRVLKDKETK